MTRAEAEAYANLMNERFADGDPFERITYTVECTETKVEQMRLGEQGVSPFYVRRRVKRMTKAELADRAKEARS